MKHVLLACMFLALSACSDSGPESHPGRGVVTEVLRAENQVVLDHGDIPGVMKAMTMSFEVTPPALLDGIEVGQIVDFEIRYRDGRYFVSALEPQQQQPGARPN